MPRDVVDHATEVPPGQRFAGQRPVGKTSLAQPFLAQPFLAQTSMGQVTLAQAAVGRVGVSDTPSARVEETPLRYPSYTWLMLVLSVACVALNLAFGARLLDVMTGRLSDVQFEAIRAWSQALFGCALTLFLWGTVVFPRLERTNLSWRLRWLLLVLAGMIGAVGGHYSERTAIDYFMFDRDGEIGRRAVQLHTLTQAILDARQPTHAIAVPAELLASPTGKAFLVLFLGTELHRSDDGIRAAAALSDAMEGLVAQRIGTAAQVYDNLFVPSVRSLRDAFNAYAAAQIALADEIRAIPERHGRAWNEFQDGLAQRGLVAARLARTDWPAIAGELRQGGILVPADWNPNDRAGFVAAYVAQIREQADSRYGERVIQLIGTELPPGLEWEHFVAHPDVQARWRAGLGAPMIAVLAPTMGFQAFAEQIHQPMLSRVVEPKLRVLTGPAASFAAGGALHDAAEAALRWIAVPTVALSLALIGAFWHGVASVCYVSTILAPASRVRRRLVVGTLVLIGLLVLGQRSPITRTVPFTQMEDRIADKVGPLWLLARGSVESVGMVSYWGNLVRRVVLGNHDFGLDPFARRIDDQQSRLDQLAP